MLPTLFRFWKLLGKDRKIRFFFISILMIFGSFAELLSIGAVFPFIAFLTSPSIILESSFAQSNPWLFENFEITDLLFFSSIAFIALTLFSGFIRLSVLLVTTRYSLKTAMIINDQIFRRTLFQPYLEHTKSNSSETVSALTTKSNQVCFNILLPCLNSINSLLQLFIISITLIIIDPITSLAAFSLFGLMYLLIVKFSKKRLVEDGKKMASEQQKLVKHMQEALGGIKDLIINNNQEKYLDYFKNSDKNFKEAQGMSIIIADSPRFVVETIGIVIIIVIAYWLSITSDSFAIVVPILGTIALGAQRLLPIIQLTFRSWAYIKAGIPSLEDLIMMLNKEDYSQSLIKQKDVKFTQNVKFNNVNFRYVDDSSKWILSNVSLDINKGEIIGIYGETGSGKSTFIDLFSGLIQPSEGKILIDSDHLNTNIDKSWKEKLTYVPQSIFLIDASIKENILFGNEEKEFDELKFNSVIEKAQLKQVISKLPDGIESIVGERGLSLSGGERQRIGIARALYRDTDVLIFDESTNSLDMETEKKIIDEIIKYKGQKTILMIAHRLSTLNECDRFYNVSDGNIIEDKTFLNE